MKKIVLVALMLCMIAGVTYAQQPRIQEPLRSAAGDYLFDTFSDIRLGKGDVTWSGAITFFVPSGISGDTTFNFYGSVGYFVTDYVEVEGIAAWMDTGASSGAKVSIGANRYFGQWTDNVYPYIGGSVSRAFADFDDDTLGIQLKAGVRHYLTMHMGLRYWAEFDTTTGDLFEFKGTFTGYIGIFAQPY